MEQKNLILGFDFGEKYSQFCCYDRGTHTAVSIPVKEGEEAVEFPTAIAKKRNEETWKTGPDAEKSAHAENGIWLAAQCCEHLNRAIIIEREAAEKYGWEEVCVVPRPHAGGSWATTCWKNFQDPVAVEEIRAHAGIDIGGTLIGMHLKRVAVPVRLSLSKIGEANILCARTRPKLIGGERAKYTEED